MTFEEAVQIARQEAADTGESQAVVRLQQDWQGEAVYIPIEARYASALKGHPVKIIEPKINQKMYERLIRYAEKARKPWRDRFAARRTAMILKRSTKLTRGEEAAADAAFEAQQIKEES